jgi:hypothetical protein
MGHSTLGAVTTRNDRVLSALLLVQVVAFLGGFAGFFLLLARVRLDLACAVAAGCAALIVGASKLRNYLARKWRKAVKKQVKDQVLGTLRYDDDGCWVARVEVEGKKLKVTIGGDTSPDPALVAHAHDIVASLGEFRDRARAFLEAEIETQPDFADYADEIRALDLHEVWLFWPDRPNDGMIAFAGGKRGRLWRCDYVDRTPKGLGFDS